SCRPSACAIVRLKSQGRQSLGRGPMVASLAVLILAAPLFLKGTVVTMDDAGTVSPGGVLIDGGLIKAIGDAPPAGAKVIDTKGRIYPGLINLHNHTAY